MIVNLRGMHGSGKSTMVRRIMAMYPKVTPIHVEGRRAPVGYKCRRKGWPKLFIVGSYAPPIGGGCDNMLNVTAIYEQVEKYARRGWNILYEGIVAQHGTPHIVRLHEDGLPIRVVVIAIPSKKALRSVRKRRQARGQTAPLNLKNFYDERERVRTTSARCEKFGVRVVRCSTRKSAMRRVLRYIKEY